MGPSNLCFNKAPKGFKCQLTLQNRCLKNCEMIQYFYASCKKCSNKEKTNKHRIHSHLPRLHILVRCMRLYWMSVARPGLRKSWTPSQETAAVVSKAQIILLRATLLLFLGWSSCSSVVTFSAHLQLSSSPLPIFKKFGMWQGVSTFVTLLELSTVFNHIVLTFTELILLCLDWQIA